MLGHISNYITGELWVIYKKEDGNIKDGIEESREIINNGRIFIKVIVTLW